MTGAAARAGDRSALVEVLHELTPLLRDDPTSDKRRLADALALAIEWLRNAGYAAEAMLLSAIGHRYLHLPPAAHPLR